MKASWAVAEALSWIGARKRLGGSTWENSLCSARNQEAITGQMRVREGSLRIMKNIDIY